MNLKSKLNNFLFNKNKYKEHDEAIIISCFFNPQKSIYRINAFNQFYESIKHLNHHIVECTIGNDIRQLDTSNKNISHVKTDVLLWHKESLLNKIIKTLPAKYKYILWIDADVIFENKNWMINAVEQLQKNNIIQLFSDCVHLNQYETPNNLNSDFKDQWSKRSFPINNKRIWNSFAYNWVFNRILAKSENYDIHGHVGFAWGAKREVLEKCPLYDRALIGGADHIMAHACVNQIPCSCITKSFTDDIDEVSKWSKQFYYACEGKLGVVSGTLYHIWHGDIQKREYLKRIKEFTPQTKHITKKDNNGLYTTTNKQALHYVNDYFDRRETGHDSDFLTSMVLGYITDMPFIGNNTLGSMIGAELRDASNNNSTNIVDFQNFS
jgi:hypothetical protein